MFKVRRKTDDWLQGFREYGIDFMHEEPVLLLRWRGDEGPIRSKERGVVRVGRDESPSAFTPIMDVRRFMETILKRRELDGLGLSITEHILNCVAESFASANGRYRDF